MGKEVGADVEMSGVNVTDRSPVYIREPIF